MREVEGISCEECSGVPIYYPGVHRLDGNRQNNSPTNLALVCPNCQTHFIFRFNYDDIWILRMRGLSNAEIAKTLGISRQRIWQIHKDRLAELSRLPEDKIDDLVGQALEQQEILIEQQKTREEYLRQDEEELRGLRARLDSRELRIREEELEKERLEIQRTKRRRISRKRMRARIISMINGMSSKTGGKRR